MAGLIVDDSENKPKPTIIHTSHPPKAFDNKQRKHFENISGDSDGVLAKLFHTICYDLTNNQHFSFSAWRRLMDKYLDDLVKQDPEVNRQNERGNFTKAINASKMSWKTFFKCLRLLRFVKVRIIIEGHREDGSVSAHSTTVSFVNKYGDEDTNLDVMEQAAKDARKDQNDKDGV